VAQTSGLLSLRFGSAFLGIKKQEVFEMQILRNGKTVKPQNLEAEGLTDLSPEETFFFVFVCRGPKSAYKRIEEFVKGKTEARVVFQRISKNYLVVSELQTRPLGVVKDGP
jgi:hypothetical protein